MNADNRDVKKPLTLEDYEALMAAATEEFARLGCAEFAVEALAKGERVYGIAWAMFMAGARFGKGIEAVDGAVLSKQMAARQRGDNVVPFMAPRAPLAAPPRN
jgi:hypothetical protein